MVDSLHDVHISIHGLATMIFRKIPTFVLGAIVAMAEEEDTMADAIISGVLRLW